MFSADTFVFSVLSLLLCPRHTRGSLQRVIKVERPAIVSLLNHPYLTMRRKLLSRSHIRGAASAQQMKDVSPNRRKKTWMFEDAIW